MLEGHKIIATIVVVTTILSLALVFEIKHKGAGTGASIKKERPKPLTFRISGIPKSVTKDGFQSVLTNLVEEMSAGTASRPGLLGWSFTPTAIAAHSGRFFVATATFRVPPAPSQLGSAIKHKIDKLGVDSSRLRVDLDFFGLTPLADPEEDIAVDVIAVTGLAGHPFGSWKSRGESQMWLRDYLPESIPTARILTYGYDTKLPGSQSNASILELSKKLLESIKTVRSQQEKRRPLIFIGHSLGGLVVKQALVQAAEGSQDDKVIFTSCYAIMFFGVPNRGLDISSLTSMVKGQPNEDLVKNLDPSSPFLGLLHDMFYRYFTFEDSEIISIFETRMSPTVEWSPETATWEKTGRKVMMVPRTSAIHAGRHEKTYNQLSIDRDHSDIVKFSNPSNPEYVIIESRIKRLMADAPRVILERMIDHKKKLSETEAKYVRALNAPDYAAFRRDKVEDPAPGTFRWLLENELVYSWLWKDESSMLWIRGSPGQGKTVLSKFILDHLEGPPLNSQLNAKVIFFFCYAQDERLRTCQRSFAVTH